MTLKKNLSKKEMLDFLGMNPGEQKSETINVTEQDLEEFLNNNLVLQFNDIEELKSYDMKASFSDAKKILIIEDSGELDFTSLAEISNKFPTKQTIHGLKTKDESCFRVTVILRAE